MNDHVSDDSQPFHHQQQQQQHGYPSLHRQQQQHLQQLQNQQHIFTPPPQLMSNQAQLPPHHHHPHQLHPLVQARMQQQFHHLTAPPLPPPVRSHNPQTWDGSVSGESAQEQRQQPASGGHYDRDQMFKGATEHLLSAVQQQIESMRGHESAEVEGTTAQACVNPPMQSVDVPLTSPSSQPMPDTSDQTNQVAAKDTAASESELLTVQVRITEANRELQAQKEQSQNRTVVAGNELSNTDMNQAPNTSTESQQRNTGRLDEHLQSHSEGQSKVTHSATNSSSPTPPPLCPAPGINREATENQPVTESESQSSSQSANEKGM